MEGKVRCHIGLWKSAWGAVNTGLENLVLDRVQLKAESSVTENGVSPVCMNA